MNKSCLSGVVYILLVMAILFMAPAFMGSIATAQPSIEQAYSPKNELRCLGATGPYGPFKGIDAFMKSIRLYGYNAVLVPGVHTDPVYPSKYIRKPLARGYSPDTLQTIINTCHAENVKVIAYLIYVMDANEAQYMVGFDEGKPDELKKQKTVSKSGKIIQVPRHILAGVLKEMAAMGVDGFWIDGFTMENDTVLGGQNQQADANFKQETGFDPPTKEDWESQAFRRWVKWRYQYHMANAQWLADQVRAEYPNVHLSFNTHYVTPGIMEPDRRVWYAPLNWERWREAVPLARFPSSLGASSHAKLGPSNPAQLTPFWAAMQSDFNPLRTDIWQPDFAERFALNSTTMGLRKNIPSDELGLRMSVLAAFTNRAQVWIEGQSNYDESSLDPRMYKKINDAVKAREEYFGGDKIKYCGVYLSNNTRDFWGLRQNREADPRNTSRQFTESYFGLLSMLMSDHIQFENIFDNTLDQNTLDQFPVIILPNVACMSNEACQALTGYVERGGRLIATYETSLYDEWGEQRKDFALSNLFGVTYLKTVDKVAYEPHMWVRELTVPSLNNGWKGFVWQTRRTIVHAPADTKILAYETGRNTAVMPLKEFVFEGDPKKIPAIVSRNVGKGEAIYIADDISQGYYQAPFRSERRILRSLIEKSPPPYRVEAPGQIISNAYQQSDPNRLVVHLLNLPPMSTRMFERSQMDTLDEIVPVHDIKVILRSGQAASAKLVPTGLDLELKTLEDGRQQVLVPKVSEHEMVVFTMKKQ